MRVSEHIAYLPCSDADRAVIERVLSPLPEPDGGGFEWPLTGEPFHVDSFVRIETAERRAAWSSWPRTGASLVPMLAGSGALAAVEMVALEFDTAGPSRAPEEPSVFARIAPAARGAMRAVIQALGPRPAAAVARLEAMVDAACAAGAIETVVGVMVARPDAPLRLSAGPFTPAALAAYLAAVRPDGAAAAVFAEGMAPFVDHIAVALDVAPGAPESAAVGLELYLDKRMPPPRQRWSALLGELGARGLAQPARAEALLAFARSSSRRVGERALVTLRYPRHVKVTFVAGQVAGAKGYACWRERNLSPGARQSLGL